ncbi:hypothetical protein F4860DRAFT_504301 [Xylaria cubensis]|nr:hypothetical protein F4860DRAFT_504301 [Xylaria cubensis]
MTGPTLTVTVSPAVESTQSFPSSTPPPSSLHSSTRVEPPSANHTRAPSSSHLSWSDKNLPDPPAYAVPAIDFDLDTNVDFSTTLTFVPDPSPEDTNEQSTGTSIRHSVAGSRPRTESMGKRKSMMLSRPQSWMPTSKSAPDLGYLPHVEAEERTGNQAGNDSLAPASAIQDGPRNVSSSFASFARRSWMSTSRSPSPKTGQEDAQVLGERPRPERTPSNSSIMKLRNGSRNRSGSSSSESSRSNESLTKIGNYFSKMKTVRAKGRALNELESSASSTTSLAPPSSETRKSHASETSNSTFPDEIPGARSSPAARDLLWSQFKSLEADFQRFQSKTTPTKLNLVRTSLVPFLRKLASNDPNPNLHYEDLERRATILDKWWTGLLDMLDVKTHPPVPGVDRPILLDAISIIMMRPEWRQSTPTFRPLAERNTQDRTRRRSQTGSNESTSSFQSADSAYLAESTGHNVRNMFVANLMSQMALIVDKMSLRQAPHSLVNFAGKACAYAFFFAPGIADILVRLWSLTPGCLRRIAEELKLPRRCKGESDDIVALFPPGMDKLAWSSVTLVSAALRKPAQPPLASTKIPWTGPWVARWNGRDSDLFFIFCKYYFILAEDFIPPDSSLLEKARAPGFVLVSAQMLSVLDSTLHRQAAVESTSAPPLSDTLHGVDASAVALQIAPNNSNILRGMTENRLIVLLKNLLSDTSLLFASVRYTFAGSFLAVMKAAIKNTSQFDHNACFTICDFLEEVLVVYENFVGSCTQQLNVDWPFWYEVWKKILESNNSMSEIRVLSLLFSIWETIARDQSRKEAICMDWLLTEKTFDKFFTNWCPMVRAYYMRLLCWRVCRDAGNANESDARIFLLVFTRLKTVWSHYLWLKQQVEQTGKLPPSTAPSFPTPGKRFMIIRTEIPTVQPGFRAGFDSSLTLPRQDFIDAPPTDFDSISAFNQEDTGTTKKTWSLLGKVFSFTANADNTNDLEALRRETAASRTSMTLPPQISTSAISSTSSDTDSIGSSPTFEATQYLFKFILSWNNAGTMPPPNRILTRPRLPSPAQSWIIAKGHGGSPPVMAGRPPPTRAVSGSALTGLVESARNAGSPEPPGSPSSTGTILEGRNSFGQINFMDLHEDDMPLRNAAGLNKESLVHPVKPKGSYARSVKYAGRALAEWSLVVAECNNFIERRREEGVLGLQDVEVPALGVEGFRKIC